MLTGDLVRARIEKGKIRPGFVDPKSERLLERAAALIAVYREGIGVKRGQLAERVQAVLGDATDIRLSGGILKVLQDRCEFDVAAGIDPVRLRWEVFTEAARRGPVVGAVAEQVYADVAARLNADPAALPGGLYADLPDEQVLTAIDVPSATWLLNRYNVALVQALLLHAEHVDITLVGSTPARTRQLIQAVKFHQLIHHAQPSEAGLALRIDGPASLFSQTTRYGVALAKFFPALLLQDAWSLSAEVRWKRFCPTLELSPGDGLVSHYRARGGYETREAEWFAERFLALDSGWELVRETSALTQGGEGVVVPDFTFRKGRKEAHLEILGFWRKGTVATRLDLVRRHGPPNLILAVSKRLCGDKADELGDAVVPFAEVISAKEVLRRIEIVATGPR